MKHSSKAWIACAALAAAVAVTVSIPGTSLAQSSSPVAQAGTPIVQLVETVSKKSGKNFILDPRVSGNAVLVGIDPAKITYPELLTVLQVHGFVAVESGNLVRIIPDEGGRSAPSPVIGANEKHLDAEMVTRVVRVKSLSAPQLVPILRSLLPRSAHLAAFACTNELLIVDTFENVRRIESLVATMDKGEPLALPKCSESPPRPVGSPATPQQSPPQ
jgi:general secretion pathway protein D